MLQESGSNRKSKIQWKNSKGTRMLAVLCLSVCLVVTGCSSKSASEDRVGKAAVGDSLTAEQPQVKVMFDQAVTGDTAAVPAAAKAAEKSLAYTGAGTAGTTGFSAVDSGESWNRKVIYKGNLTMEVANYAAAQVEINNLVTLSGGYILQFSENQSTLDQSGNYVIKVPANGFTSFIRDLEKIKTVSDIRHNIQGQDVSEEYVDLSSRLKAKQVVEARLLVFMEKAVKTDELLSFSNELAKVQETIEQIKGRMRYLDQNVALATVEIRLYQQGIAKINADPIGDSTLTKTINALKSSIHALKEIAQGLIIFVAAVLPVLIVLAIIGIPIFYYMRNRKRKMALNAPKPSEYNQKIDTNETPPGDSE